ncbi:MAG: hypothetical protein ACRDTJ_03450 [Pseudonocardiaceae bacterium]
MPDTGRYRVRGRRRRRAGGPACRRDDAVLWPVPNATDVLLHTNPGRASLSPGARQARRRQMTVQARASRYDQGFDTFVITPGHRVR